MPPLPAAQIRKHVRLFDDFFQIDEVIVSHLRRDGTMSPDERRLVFERGDSVAVLLINLDSQSVVLTKQFRTPVLLARRRDDPQTADGWLTEAVAGMVEANETPAETARREVEEETGYRVGSVHSVGQFYASPGGSSERIFVYVAHVREADRVTQAGSAEEDITVVQMPLRDLFAAVAAGTIEDPKLLIAAYWLKDHLESVASAPA